VVGTRERVAVVRMRKIVEPFFIENMNKLITLLLL
jgi:hypothetical protein